MIAVRLRGISQISMIFLWFAESSVNGPACGVNKLPGVLSACAVNKLAESEPACAVDKLLDGPIVCAVDKSSCPDRAWSVTNLPGLVPTVSDQARSGANQVISPVSPPEPLREMFGEDEHRRLGAFQR